MAKDEMIFLGGELDGLTLDASDKTLPWPIRVVFEMLTDDGKTPNGDGVCSGIMKTKKLKYTLLHSGESSNGDAFVQYMPDGTEECEYDTNRYVIDPSEPFCPDEFKST